MKSNSIEFPTVFRAFPQLSLNYLPQYPTLEHHQSVFFLHFKAAFSVSLLNMNEYYNQSTKQDIQQE